jgi:hypothetical protein
VVTVPGGKRVTKQLRGCKKRLKNCKTNEPKCMDQSFGQQKLFAGIQPKALDLAVFHWNGYALMKLQLRIRFSTRHRYMKTARFAFFALDWKFILL